MQITLNLHTVPQAIGAGYLHLTEEEIEAQKNQGESRITQLGSHSAGIRYVPAVSKFASNKDSRRRDYSENKRLRKEEA